jgi:hypothetical protein
MGCNRQLDETKTGLRPDRLICKTFPNNFNREIKTSFSVEKKLETNNWSKKITCLRPLNTILLKEELKCQG